jgi:hypothetical protein
MLRSRALALALVPLLAAGLAPAAGCAETPTSRPSTTTKPAPCKPVEGTLPVKPKTRPERIQVQHILIAFDGSLPGQKVERTKEQAKELAYRLLEEARCGADFDTLVKTHTNDSFPGIYGMTNFGVPADRNRGEYPREGMVPAFGNVGFEISVGNIGIADFDAEKSPYGWHLIKRLK